MYQFKFTTQVHNYCLLNVISSKVKHRSCAEMYYYCPKQYTLALC